MRTLKILLLSFALTSYFVVSAQTISLHSKDWYTSQFGPSLRVITKGGTPAFTFPSTKETAVGGLLDYRAFPLASDGFLSATFTVSTAGSPIFRYDTEVANTCVFPAHVRLYFQADPALWTNSDGDTFRWFSNPLSFELGSGTITLTTPLTSDQWSTVYGRFGNTDASTQAGFMTSLQRTETVGLVFGGGCFFGHGVYVSGGTGQFTLQSISAF